MRFFTHVHPDLDAIASVWAYIRFIFGYGFGKPSELSPVELALKEHQILFVPANWDGAGMEKDDVAIDIEAGGKGIKGKKLSSGRVMSAFATIIPDAGGEIPFMLQSLTDFIEAQDSTGDGMHAILSEHFVKRMAGTPIQRTNVPESLRIGGLMAVLGAYGRRYKNDLTLLVEYSRLLDDLYEGAVHREKAHETAKNCPKVGSVAIAENVPLGVNGALFERGAKVVVYHDGHSVGAVRSSEHDFNIGDIVKPLIEAHFTAEAKEWFYHSAGFLAARGTMKSPATSPSKITPEALAAWISQHIDHARPEVSV